MRRHFFCVAIVAAAFVAAVFLIAVRPECEQALSCADCSYCEALAIYQGIQDITNVSVFDLAHETYGNVWHIEDGLARKVTYAGEEISYLLFSPSKKLLGFYHNKPGDERAGKDVVLEIMDIETKAVTAAYEGDYKTSSWEWIDDGRIIVYYNCGSPCYGFTIISTGGETLDGPRMLGLSYALSPDKQWLLGSVDWAQTLGAAVMNIKTKKEYKFVQTGIPSRQYARYAASAWSADSKKLALLNKQSASQNLEATVYDVADDFKATYRQAVACEFIEEDLLCDMPASPELFLAGVLEK